LVRSDPRRPDLRQRRGDDADRRLALGSLAARASCSSGLPSTAPRPVAWPETLAGTNSLL